MLQLVGEGKVALDAPVRRYLPGLLEPGFEVTDGWRYGLGIARHELPCGGWAWGHGGDIQGFETRNLVTGDGRGAVVAITALPSTEATAKAVDAAVDTALCA